MGDPVLLAASVALGGLVGSSWRSTVDWFQDVDRGSARMLCDEMIAVGLDPALLARYLLAWRVLAVGLLLTFWVALSMPPVALVSGGIALHVAPKWVRNRIAAYRRQVGDQVAGVARNLAGQRRAGLSLSEAFLEVGRDAPAPLGHHLRRTARDLAHGCGIRQALSALTARVRVESLGAMVVALQVAEERGGKLADVLDRIAFAADENARVERKRESDTAAGRLMISIMALFPVGFLGLFHSFDPEMLKAVTGTLRGQCLLGGVLVVVYASVRWGWYVLAKAK